MKSRLFPIIIVLLFVLSCDKKEDPIIVDPTIPVGTTIATIVPNGDEQYLTKDSDYIFDQSKLPTFQLVMTEDALAAIDADPAAEEYVEGMLIFEGDTISPVGIRYKGSIGAFVNCVSGANLTNPTGFKTCTKLSMKVKINWEGRTEKFYKLKKLQFHSQNLDASQMRERLGYNIFREMGVPAPRSVHARLMINGNYSGLYALTEQIDGRFVKYNYEDDDGNLYKEVWPLNSNGQAQQDQKYLSGLKTNEDDNPSVEIIKNFAQKVVDAEPAALQDVIAESMDINEIIAYAVVDRTIRHDDGPFHWYCGNGDCESHNFYWYEEPNNEKLHLIPWDLDNAFENIIFDANPVTPIADAWGEISNDCQAFPYGGFNFYQRSAACDKLTAGWASFTEEYQQLKTQLINGPLSKDRTDMLLDTWSNQIRIATIEANELHSDAISIEEWENAVNNLKSQLDFARNN